MSIETIGIISDPANGRYDIIPADCDCKHRQCDCGEVDDLFYEPTNQPTMKTFKNKNFGGRDCECMNVVFCVAETAPDENWIETDESMPASIQHLWTQDGAQFFGWL